MVYQPRQQYHLFSLPAELLASLTPRTLVNQPAAQESTPPPTPPPISENASRACNICLAASFANVDEQRAHFRSDWHRYNVKARLNGSKPVSEPDFASMLDRLEDSLSGSESSDSEGSDSDAVNTLVNRTKRLQTRPESPSDDTPNAPRTAITWFHSPPSTQIGVYRAIFSAKDDLPSAQLDELRELQVSPPEGRRWAMFMVAGGHFAAAIVRVSAPPDDEDAEDATTKKKKKLKQPKPDTEVLRHKTFHRYTTRRKQGGSQSLNDNSKSKAVSAGAMLRRYGEQALRDDIRGLLDEWAEDIAACERIWLRASTANRKIFLDYDGAPIAKADPRLRTFPFPTRRPTQAELARCLQELVRAKVSHFTEEELQAQDAAARPKPRPAPAAPSAPAPAAEKPRAPKLTPEEQALRDKWARLLDMVARGRLEPLQAFWAREGGALGGPDARIPAWAPEARGARTLLQLAAREGQADVARWLLADAGADPTVPADEGRAAYDLARAKEVRDVFRRAAGAAPERWDWFGAGHVPSALMQDAEEAREEKRRTRRKGLKEKVKEREAREKERQGETAEVQPQPVPAPVQQESKAGPRKLGGTAGAAEGIAGLTPEMRARVERERRARAAEARLKGIAG
ncbi:hypothetical protein HDZ31DRAFT_30881 [Schizophyllum fasciatum]